MFETKKTRQFHISITGILQCLIIALYLYIDLLKATLKQVLLIGFRGISSQCFV